MGKVSDGAKLCAMSGMLQAVTLGGVTDAALKEKLNKFIALAAEYMNLSSKTAADVSVG